MILLKRKCLFQTSNTTKNFLSLGYFQQQKYKEIINSKSVIWIQAEGGILIISFPIIRLLQKGREKNKDTVLIKYNELPSLVFQNAAKLTGLQTPSLNFPDFLTSNPCAPST